MMVRLHCTEASRVALVVRTSKALDSSTCAFASNSGEPTRLHSESKSLKSIGVPLSTAAFTT